MIILSTVPDIWIRTVQSIRAASRELVDTTVDIHLFGIDGTALLETPVLSAFSPNRLLIDVARMGAVISPDTRMDSMVHRMAHPEASGLIVSRLSVFAVDGWWQNPEHGGTEAWAAARDLAQIVCESKLAVARDGERTILHAALGMLAPMPPLLTQRELARVLLAGVLPRVDLLVVPGLMIRRAKQWIVHHCGHDGLANCVKIWRTATRLDAHDHARWESVGADFSAAVDAAVEGIPNTALTAEVVQQIIEPIETAIKAAVAEALDIAARFNGTGLEIVGNRSGLVEEPLDAAGIGLPRSRMLSYSDPTDAERTARDLFADKLSEASYRSPGVRSVPVAYPAGRLNPRELVRYSAQTQLGLQATAKPWTQQRIAPRARVQLTFAMVFDASLTMARWANYAGPLGWATASAVHQLGGTCTVRGFGGGTFDVIKAGTAPAQVPRVVDSGSGSDGCDIALTEVIADSDILNRTGARIVVVLTDGKLPADDAAAIDNAIDLLRDSGTLVLWVLPSAKVTAPVIPERTTVLTSVTPESFIAVVSQAVIDELERA